MTSNLRKQQFAEQDLVEIWLYTANQWDENQADAYLDKIDAALKTLIANPLLGKDCGHVRPGYRKLSTLYHSIYYYLSEDSIEMVRVLHQRMDEGQNIDIDS